MPFDPEKRLIFAYYDGTLDAENRFRKRFGDPIQLYEDLLDAAGGEEAFAKLWDKVFAGGDLPRKHDREMLEGIIRRVFHLKEPNPYEPGGLHQTEVFLLMDEFAEWQKKNLPAGDGSPNSSQPTPDSPSRSTSFPTTPTSGSGSIGIGPEPFRPS
jgi:hypothetical protein